TTMEKKAIGPGGSGEGREPVVADCEVASERMKCGQRVEIVVLHDLGPIVRRGVGIAAREVTDEASVSAEKLLDDVRIVVVRILRHDPTRAGSLRVDGSLLVGVLTRRQPHRDTFELRIDLLE